MYYTVVGKCFHAMERHLVTADVGSYLVQTFVVGVHAVWFIRDTSIRDMVEFPKQSKGHMVIGTIGSDTAKGQSSF